MQKSKHNIIDVIAYGIKTGASDSEIAEHFGWKTKTLQEYKYRLNKTNPELVKQLQRAQEERKKEVNESTGKIKQALNYGLETGASDKEIAEHFGWETKTWRHYKTRLNKTNPEQIKQLKKAQEERKLSEPKEDKRIEAIEYGIRTRASDTEIAELFGWKLNTWQIYKSDIKKIRPDLVEQLHKAREGKISDKKLEAINYGIETGLSDKEIARSFGWDVKTFQTYKRQVKEKMPELIEKLYESQQKRGQNRTSREQKLEAIQYGIANRASDKEIADHFGWDIKSWRQAKYKSKKTAPELVEQLYKVQRESAKKQRKKAVKEKENPIAYGIRTGASDEEIADHFGWKIDTWLIYKITLIQNNPELEAKLRNAQEERKERRRQAKSRKVTQKSVKPVIVQPIKISLEENKPKPKVVKRNTQELFDTLLKVFDKGKVDSLDVTALAEYKKELEESTVLGEDAQKAKSTLLYTIKSMINVSRQSYEQTLLDMKKFVSKRYYGPLYEIEDNSSIAQIARQINDSTIYDVTTVEVAMCINQMLDNEEVSKKVNLASISNIRSRLEDCNEKIGNYIMQLTGEER